MSEFKGTPGPWIVRSQEIQSVGTEDKMTAMCYGIENANLIAAAPDLLEALQDALHAHDKHGEHSEWDFARAAIARALGQ